MGYKVIDVSGDIGLRAEGKTLEECFINAGIGLYSLITDLNLVEQKEEKKFELAEETKEDLLVSFLNELIFLFDTYGFIGKSIKLKINGACLEANIYGDFFNPEKHERRLLVKAATYHNFVLKEEDNLWIAEIIFDI